MASARGGHAAALMQGGGMKSILDPSFRYTSSVNTDLRKTFARIRRDQRKTEEVSARTEAESLHKILPMLRKQQASY